MILTSVSYLKILIPIEGFLKLHLMNKSKFLIYLYHSQIYLLEA